MTISIRRMTTPVIFCVVMVCALWIVAGGCASLRGALPSVSFPFGKPAAPPKIVVRYFPYGPSLDRRFFAPVPDYRLWTDSRMVKDLDRMGAAGIDEVVVHVSSEGFGPAFRRERFGRFVVLASKPGVTRPRVVFELGADISGNVDLFSAFQAWFLHQHVGGLSAYLREESGRPLIFFENAGNSPALRHPAIAYRGIGPGNAWAWSHPAPEDLLTRAGRRRVVAICAGLLSGRDERGRLIWKIPRHGGRTIRAELRAACNLGAETILVSSWNDFSSGDCLEPNTYDGNEMIEAFSREIQRLRVYWNEIE